METTYDPPDDGATGAILEICEIEVYGTKKTPTNKSISKIHKEGLLPFKMRDSGGCGAVGRGLAPRAAG